MAPEGNLQRIALLAPAVGGLAVFLYKYFGRATNGNRGLPFPPGPKPLPLLGNILDYPIDYSWLTLDRYSKQYGDVIHMNVGGQHIIVLSSMKAVEDLLEKRSAIYSDRPQSIMLNQIMGWNFSFVHLPYGEEWRKRRRAFHSQFHQNVVGEHQAMQLRRTRVFLGEVLKNPDDALALSHLLLGATIMKAVYGLESRGRDDKYLKIADDVVRRGATATVPGAYLVDLIPALRYIPSWFPGAKWKRFGEETAELVKQMIEEPFEAVKREMAQGTAAPSMVANLLGQGNDDTVTREAAGIAYGAGADTTQGIISLFLNAMMNHPEIQAKAQAELDKVVGRDRLPDFSDREKLPYANGIIKELVRWQPITPLAAPHASIADDVYNGYFIPKGSFILGNVWSIGHDPEVYPNPDKFDPERFLKITSDGGYELDPTVRDPARFCFGFGRRICPGRHLAEQSIYAVITSLLATCNITPVCDSEGRPIDSKLKMTPTILSTPVAFRCNVEPRSAWTVELINRAIDESSTSHHSE